MLDEGDKSDKRIRECLIKEKKMCLLCGNTKFQRLLHFIVSRLSWFYVLLIKLTFPENNYSALK